MRLGKESGAAAVLLRNQFRLADPDLSGRQYSRYLWHSDGALSKALKLLPANQVSAIIVLNPLITLLVAGVLSFQKLPWLSSESITLPGYAGALLLLAGVGLVVKKA